MSKDLLRDYSRIERAILHLERGFPARPTLAELAREAGLSEFHFQRLFARWAGISPQRFLQMLTLQHAKALLQESRSLLEASLDSGLSGPARLHDLFVTIEALTPGEYKKAGDGMRIEYAFCPSPFGETLIARTSRGVCGMSFVGEAGRAASLAELQSRWPRATWVSAPSRVLPLAGRIFGNPGRGRSGAVDTGKGKPIPLLVRGTNFQLRVWEAILRIPPGACLSYRDVAELAGAPGAIRAVGTALGRNPVAYLIPCHRVIRATGVISGYRWGTARKRAILAWESGRRT